MDKIRKIDSLIKEREKILKEIRKIGNFMRGTMYKTYRRCGRESCWCYKSEKGHPLTLLTLHLKGKQVSLSVPKEKEEEVKRMLKEYKNLWKKIDDLTEINLEILRRSK